MSTEKPFVSLQPEIDQTIQRGTFRDYAVKFLELENKNARSEFPRSASEMRYHFLRNMRNKQLRNLLLLVDGDIMDLFIKGQEFIIVHSVWDFQDPRKSNNRNIRNHQNFSRNSNSFSSYRVKKNNRRNQRNGGNRAVRNYSRQ